MMKKENEIKASCVATMKGTGKRVKISWLPRKNKEGDVWIIQTSRIIKRKRVNAPIIFITDDTIQILLGAIYRIRTLGEFKPKEKNSLRKLPHYE